MAVFVSEDFRFFFLSFSSYLIPTDYSLPPAFSSPAATFAMTARLLTVSHYTNRIYLYAGLLPPSRDAAALARPRVLSLSLSLSLSLFSPLFQKKKRKGENCDQLAHNGSLNLINAIYAVGDKYIPAD